MNFGLVAIAAREQAARERASIRAHHYSAPVAQPAARPVVMSDYERGAAAAKQLLAAAFGPAAQLAAGAEAARNLLAKMAAPTGNSDFRRGAEEARRLLGRA